MISHDLEASQTRQCISEICEEIRLLEKQDGTEYKVSMLRARKQDLKDELMDYNWHFYLAFREWS